MNRAAFESQFEELGLNLSVYGDAAYYGACPDWSLSLRPYGSDRIHHAKLAIDSQLAKKNRTVVDTFLSAAAVERTAQLDSALAAGSEFRDRVGAKVISFSSVGPDLILNVME